MRLSEGEARGGGAQRPSILADALEAPDRRAPSWTAASTPRAGLVQRLFGEVIATTDMGSWSKDAKTELQEWLQARRLPCRCTASAPREGRPTRRPSKWNVRVPALGLVESGEGRSRRSRRAGGRAPHARRAECQRQARRPAALLNAIAARHRMSRRRAHRPRPNAAQRCGLVAIVGRPNVGKSTLLNALVGQKVSITSQQGADDTAPHHRHPHRRTQRSSSSSTPPGFQTQHAAALNRTLNRTVHGVLADVDVVLFVVEAGRFGLDDAKVLALLPRCGKPVLLVANKLDTRGAPRRPRALAQGHAGAPRVCRVRADVGQEDADVQRLLGIVEPYLPEQTWFYDEDALTDRSDRFMAGEMIREKLFRLTGDELPYSSHRRDRPLRGRRQPAPHRRQHRRRARGAQGHGHRRRRRAPQAHRQEARQELEVLLDAKVFLELWVKVRSGWADDEEHLRSYGYE